MYRYKFNVEYDGTLFCGWQKQKNVPNTIQEKLETAIFNFSGIKVDVCGAGRTDAGVHSIGQVAHFDLNKKIESYVVNNAINFYLKCSGISVYNVECLGENSIFHSRFSAKERTYIYKMMCRNYPLTFQSKMYWLVCKKLNIDAMTESANFLLGTHDFSTFRASNCQSKSPIKTLSQIKIKDYNDNIEIIVSAPSFLYHQVRNIVGALYFVGLNKWSVKDFLNAFLLKDRTKGAITAPAYGLYFYKVDY